MLHRIACRGREEHLPASPRVSASPERGVSRINHLVVRGVEGKGINSTTQIEHAPGLAIIPRNIRAGHIAVLYHQPRIVRANGGSNHRTAPAGSNHFPVVQARRLSLAGYSSYEQQGS